VDKSPLLPLGRPGHLRFASAPFVHRGSQYSSRSSALSHTRARTRAAIASQAPGENGITRYMSGAYYHLPLHRVPRLWSGGVEAPRSSPSAATTGLRSCTDILPHASLTNLLRASCIAELPRTHDVPAASPPAARGWRTPHGLVLCKAPALAPAPASGGGRAQFWGVENGRPHLPLTITHLTESRLAPPCTLAHLGRCGTHVYSG